MVQVQVYRIEEQREDIYCGPAVWTDLSISFGFTLIYYTKEEVVIKKKNDIPAHLIFVEKQHSQHLYQTQVGKLVLGVFTEKIVVSNDKIEINYYLENVRNKLVIERI